MRKFVQEVQLWIGLRSVVPLSSALTKNCKVNVKMNNPSQSVISMEPLLTKYNEIRGKSKLKDGFDFWDVVVLSTADNEQKKAYEIQIDNKLKRKELPLDIQYLVISDPAGPKVGNGGSIMHCLQVMLEQFPDQLLKWRVLIIPAGGQSQRLPSASVLGKVFTALPVGDPMYQMLDLQLALYLPFLAKMQPGVFIACPDIITTFNMDKNEDSDWSFMKPGFTVLAHPSNIEVGKGHGVYVIENPENLGRKKVEFAQCLEVLQKPSEEVMRSKGAVVMKTNDASGDQRSEDSVYVDSVFFFDHEITCKLIALYKEISPLTCEIDGYGDFLQSVGPRASIDFTSNVANVSSLHPNLILTRQKVFHTLKGTPINLVMLNESRFNHIGTTKEYLHHYCNDPQLASEMSLKKHVMMSLYTGPEAKRSNIEQEGSVLHSQLHSSSILSSKCVVEYSDFDVPLSVQANCIVSNCQYLASDVSCVPAVLEIPKSTFLHTVPVTVDSNARFVTVLFGTQDNLKKKVDAKNADELMYLDQPMSEMLQVMGGKSTSEIFPKDKPCGLWFAKLFPVAESMSVSFSLALQALHFVKSEGTKPDFSQYTCLSMHDVLNLKDVKRMICYRNELFQKL